MTEVRRSSAVRAGSPLRAALAGVLVVAAGATCAFAQLRPLLESKKRLSAASVPLYVPSPLAARVMSAGHASTLADLMYLWAIQHFSEPAADAADRRGWLRRVYGTITDLDPKFRDAYWLGYVSLLIEGRSPDLAFELVDKALANDPGFTLLAVEGALTARQKGRLDLSVKYLQIASSTGDKLATRLLLRLREVETAQDELAAWAELEEDDDGLTRAIAREHVRDLTMLIESAELSALVRCYRDEHAGMLPGSLQQLVTAGYLSGVPVDPEGKEYLLDPRTGAVTPATRYRYRPPTNSRLGVNLSELGRCAPPQWRAP